MGGERSTRERERVAGAAPRRGRRSLLAAAAAATLVAGLLGAVALADIVHLEGGGVIRGEIVEETETHLIVRTPYGSTHLVPFEEVARIEREGNPAEDFERRFNRLDDQDADGFAELGAWAQERGLSEQAKRAFERAIEIEPDHHRARMALGHRRHRGRWYDAESYRRAVEGLVEYEGRWVTPVEKAFYEAGFTRNERGEWVRAEDLERQRMDPPEPDRDRSRDRGDARRDDGGTSEPQTEPRRPPRPVAPQPPPVGDDEDLSWYDDHETVMSWEEALRRPYETRYYRIYTNIRPEYAERYGRMLDTYNEIGFQRVFNARENLRGGVPKGDVYIYPSQQAFMQTEQMGASVGGYYQPGRGRVVCYHGRFGSTGTTQTVLIHEATHQFQDYVLPGRMWNAPVWIIEGFAVFFESARYDHEEDRVIIGHVPRDRLSTMKRAVAQGNHIPLPELLRTPQPAFTGFHYAHAWSLIYYMIYGGSESRRAGAGCTHRPRCRHQRAHNQEIFSDLFFLARERRVHPEDTENLFGGPEAFAQFEEQWKEWIRMVPYDFDPRTMDFDDIRRDYEQGR